MIEKGNPMSDTPEAERVLKIAAFGFDRPEEAPLDDFPCCSDTELHACNSDAAQSDREALADLLMSGPVMRSKAMGRDYALVEAVAILAAGWRPPVTADHPTEPLWEEKPDGRIGMTAAGQRVWNSVPVRVEPTTDKPINGGAS